MSARLLGVVVDLRYLPRDVELFSYMRTCVCGAMKAVFVRLGLSDNIRCSIISIDSKVTVYVAGPFCLQNALRIVNEIQLHEGQLHTSSEGSLVEQEAMRIVVREAVAPGYVLIFSCLKWSDHPMYFSTLSHASCSTLHIVLSAELPSSRSLAPGHRVTSQSPTNGRQLLASVSSFIRPLLTAPVRQVSCVVGDVKMVLEACEAVQPLLNEVVACACHNQPVRGTQPATPPYYCCSSSKRLNLDSVYAAVSIGGEVFGSQEVLVGDKPDAIELAALERIPLNRVPHGVLYGVPLLMYASESYQRPNAEMVSALSEELHKSSEGLLMRPNVEMTHKLRRAVGAQVVLVTGEETGTTLCCHTVATSEMMALLPQDIGRRSSYEAKTRIQHELSAVPVKSGLNIDNTHHAVTIVCNSVKQIRETRLQYHHAKPVSTNKPQGPLPVAFKKLQPPASKRPRRFSGVAGTPALQQETASSFLSRIAAPHSSNKPQPFIQRRKMKANEQETLERNKRWIVMLLLVVAVTVRCMIIMHPHSGQGKPPMYGDYEAQRHWMEITTALPTSEWYVHGEDNDLQYWGLDYPPVTAYHSYVLGRVGKWIVPEAFELHTSRGHEEYNSKIFMKLSVLFSELLIYMPAAWYAVNGVAHVKAPTTAKIDALALLWLHPCVLLIDHGHFQYNTVCFGLALAAVGCIARHKYLLGSFFFTASFLFKQIGLYYAPAMFFGILSLCMSEGLSQGVGNVLTTGLVVVATVCLIFYPWLGDIEGAGHVVHRMFPFARGVFEDKVANVWCTLSLVVKLQKMLEVETMLKVATGCTLLTLIPGCLCCFRRSYSSGPWVAALVISASSFYLFSFQVHEKSVMFPIIMAALLPVATPKSRNSHHTARAVTVLTAVAMFSMFPLVVKDNLQVLYTALMLATVGACELICHSHKRWRLCWHFVLLTMLTAHVIHATVAPPAHLPDLWTMLITSLSCMYFLIASAALSFGQLRGSFDLAYNPKVE